MPQGEGVIINGGGVPDDADTRWGDYTSMNVDPVDDCTFWYVNEYLAKDGPGALADADCTLPDREGCVRLTQPVG